MRNDLILVAIRLLGEHDYDSVSKWRLASEANTMMSSITYHCGGKRGLYQAAGPAILGRTNAALAERPIPTLGPGAGPKEAAHLIEQVIIKMGGLMLQPKVTPMSRFVEREHNAPPSSIGKILRMKAQQVGHAISGTIAILRLGLSQEQCRTRAFFNYAMITSHQNARAPLCAITEMTKPSEQQGQDLLAELKSAAREMLEHP